MKLIRNIDPLRKWSSEKLILVSLAISTLSFAYGEEPCCICTPMPPAYNYPSVLEITCPQNIYTAISFNYWQPLQENMELGLLDRGKKTNITLTGPTTTFVATSNSFEPINMDFDFKPGFTIVLGYNFGCDDWRLRTGYTWFHCTNKKSTTVNDFVLFDENTPNISPTWGIFAESERDIKYESASEKWKLGMDIVDVDLGRSYYVGCKLTFYPSIGVRVAFIQQNVDVSYINGFVDFSVDVPGLLGDGVLVEDKKISNSSHSWALGPKIALETNWILGCGFSLFGSGEVDLLYTRYTSLKEKAQTTGTVVGIIDFIPFSFDISDKVKSTQKNTDYLRAHLDLGLGIEWGTYFNCNKYYIDFSAGYTFQAFFDQNMLRHNVASLGSFIPNGNLYIQGLIATLRLDF